MRVVVPVSVADALIRDGSARSSDAQSGNIPGGFELQGVLTVWMTASTIVWLNGPPDASAERVAEELGAWRPGAYEPEPGFEYEISAQLPTGNFRFGLGVPPDTAALRDFLRAYFERNWDEGL